jgi:hypothetical protein
MKYITKIRKSILLDKVSDPFSLSDREIGLQIEACKARLRELKSVAPLLCLEHLRNCISLAREHGDTKAVIRIRQIIRNEKLWKRWGGVKHATTPGRGGAPTSICAQSDSGNQQFDTREEVAKQRTNW